MTRRVLVTGASGFIGRHATRPLVEAGFDVHASGRQRPADFPEGAVFHQADLLDPEQCCDLVEGVRPTHLMHFAWYAVPGKYWTAAENVRWVQASLGLMEAFARAGGQRLVMAGTCAEYDWSHGYCIEESTPLVPATLYGTCKHALRMIISARAEQLGISSAWGRIFSLYGPHENPVRLVASVITSLLRGDEALCGDGSPVRDYLHVSDVASAFVALLVSSLEGAVNIGSGSGVALKDIVETIGSMTGRPDLVRLGVRPPSIGEPRLLIANTDRLAQTGWKPRFDLESGLDDAIAWWRHDLSRAAIARGGRPRLCLR